MINKTDYELLNEIYNTKVPDTKGLPLGVQQGATSVIIVKKEEQPTSKGNLAVKDEKLGINLMVVTEGNNVCVVLSSIEGNVIKLKGTSLEISDFFSRVNMAINDLHQMTKPSENN